MAIKERLDVTVEAIMQTRTKLDETLCWLKVQDEDSSRENIQCVVDSFLQKLRDSDSYSKMFTKLQIRILVQRLSVSQSVQLQVIFRHPAIEYPSDG